MSNPACDGDAVTLQALCDALKITVRVTKLIEADHYDAAGQTGRLLASSRSSSDFCQGFTESRDSSSLILDEDSCSFGSSDTSSSYASAISHDSVKNMEMRNQSSLPVCTFTVQDKGTRKRLYISHDIQPRCIGTVDSEIRRFASHSQGRLIWVSHIGDEAHYRLLRLKPAIDAVDSCVFNRDEEVTACESRILRMLKLQASNQLYEFDSSKEVSSPLIPITCLKIGVRAHLGDGRCSLCLKTIYDDAFETRDSSSFCNIQCLATWSKLCVQKSPPSGKQYVINLVDDTQASIMISDEAAASDADLKLSTTTSRAKHSQHRPEIFSRLRPRSTRSYPAKVLRSLKKRPIRPVERYGS